MPHEKLFKKVSSVLGLDETVALPQVLLQKGFRSRLTVLGNNHVYSDQRPPETGFHSLRVQLFSAGRIEIQIFYQHYVLLVEQIALWLS